MKALKLSGITTALLILVSSQGYAAGKPDFTCSCAGDGCNELDFFIYAHAGKMSVQFDQGTETITDTWYSIKGVSPKDVGDVLSSGNGMIQFGDYQMESLGIYPHLQGAVALQNHKGLLYLPNGSKTLDAYEIECK